MTKDQDTTDLSKDERERMASKKAGDKPIDSEIPAEEQGQ